MRLLNIKANDKGITLITLVITVIVLLILAGTAITIILNNENLMSKAADTRDIWDNRVENTSDYYNNNEKILNKYIQ